MCSNNSHNTNWKLPIECSWNPLNEYLKDSEMHSVFWTRRISNVFFLCFCFILGALVLAYHWQIHISTEPSQDIGISPGWPPPFIRSWWASRWLFSWVWPLWVDWALGDRVKLWPKFPTRQWSPLWCPRPRWQHRRQRRRTKWFQLPATVAGVTMMSWVSGTRPSTVTLASTCSVVVPASTASAASSKSTVWTRLPVPTTTHPCGQTQGSRPNPSRRSTRNQTEIGPTWSCILSVEWWPSWCWSGFSPSLGWRRVKEDRLTWPTPGMSWGRWTDRWYWVKAMIMFNGQMIDWYD